MAGNKAVKAVKSKKDIRAENRPKANAMPVSYGQKKGPWKINMATENGAGTTIPKKAIEKAKERVQLADTPHPGVGLLAMEEMEKALDRLEGKIEKMAATLQRAPPQATEEGITSCLRTYNITEGTVSCLQTFGASHKDKVADHSQPTLLPAPPDETSPSQRAGECIIHQEIPASTGSVDICNGGAADGSNQAAINAGDLLSGEGTYRIVDIEPKDAPTGTTADGGSGETREEKRARWMEEIFGPGTCEHLTTGGEARFPDEPVISVPDLVEEIRKRDYEKFERKLGNKSMCRQTLTLLATQGSEDVPVKINGLFAWKKPATLILNAVASEHQLEICEDVERRVDTLYSGKTISKVTYWVPLEKWDGETIYVKAYGVEYIGHLPGHEFSGRALSEYPELAGTRDEQVEEPGDVELMIALDNWQYMPVRRASRITDPGGDLATCTSVVQSQFGKRCMVLYSMDAFELIPPGDESDHGEDLVFDRCRGMTQREADAEERRDVRQLEDLVEELYVKVESNSRRAKARKRRVNTNSVPYRDQAKIRSGTRSLLVGIVAILAATLGKLPGAEGFQAYDCSNSSNPVEMYSLLDPEPCPDVSPQHIVERVMQGEIVQLKRERLIKITRCHVVQSVFSQYCGWQSRAGVVRYLKFREPYTVEPSACRGAIKTGMLKIEKKSYLVKEGAIQSFTDFTEGSLDLGHNCQVGTHTHGEAVLDRQVTQTVWEVSVRQEWARVNEVSGLIITTSGLIAPVTDKSMMDTADGTYVWDYSQEDCPDSIVQLYLGDVKVLTNSTASFSGGLAIVEGSEKDQVAGLELTESFVLCGRAAQRTHIKNIVIFFHPMTGMQVASGKFSTATGEAEITRLESEVSFLQVKATMSLQERIRQVKAEICENRRQIAHVRLESLAGAENPYSLMQVFGRGHQVTKNGATVYVTKCQPVEVVPRQHTECTNEVPVTFNGTEVFVDPISLVIKTAAAPVRCNDIAPPRWKLGGKWYCSFPALRDCAEPAELPVDPVRIADVDILGLGLGKSIYSKEQMEEFSRFQDSQNTRRAYLAETAEIAYLGRSGGEWGLGLTDLAKDQIASSVGYHLVPLYRLVGPTAIIIIFVMFIVGGVRMLVDIFVRAIVIARVRGCGFWLFGALWDTAFQIAVSPIRWAARRGREGAGRIKNQMEARAAYNGSAAENGMAEGLDILSDWAASWRRKVYGSGPLADRNNEPAPRGRESASSGSRPLSGEDRELLH